MEVDFFGIKLGNSKSSGEVKTIVSKEVYIDLSRILQKFDLPDKVKFCNYDYKTRKLRILYNDREN